MPEFAKGKALRAKRAGKKEELDRLTMTAREPIELGAIGQLML